jgi:IMP dehydrogenase
LWRSLKPQTGVLNSRKNADISSEVISGLGINIPILSANMPAITGADMAIAMAKNGALGIMHRFMTLEEHISEAMTVKDSVGLENVACSIGLDGILRTEKLLDYCKTFFLDIAHADSQQVYKFVREWKEIYKDEASLAVGNIASYESAMRFAHYGVSAVKIGIGPGAACTTREVTGFGVPQLSAILDVVKIKEAYPHIKIIADGGIKNSGDIVKALAAGADTVMVGRLLAGASETPEPGIYYGSASQFVNGHNAPEGAYGEVKKTGPVVHTLKNLAWGIKSGISYGGAKNIKELQLNAEWIKVSHGTSLENATRF